MSPPTFRLTLERSPLVELAELRVALDAVRRARERVRASLEHGSRLSYLDTNAELESAARALESSCERLLQRAADTGLVLERDVREPEAAAPKQRVR
jgi:hypothetical protein